MFRSEPEFVRWLASEAHRRDPRVRLGIGDDAALVSISRKHELVLTTDFSIAGVHFDERIHPPESAGHRALARALSDLAAMGATPRFALISLAISKRTTRQWLERFYAGMRRLAQRFAVSIIGGDTAVVSGTMTVDVVAAGEIAHGRAIRRSGARAGDLIYVSGRLGLAELGLRILKSRPSQRAAISRNPEVASEAVHRHLFPEPQCGLGIYLAANRLASAMMDISDGLSADLARLCEASKVGAQIRADLIPAARVPPSDRALKLALHGGEDYELLFTVSPAKAKTLPSRFRGTPISPIGVIRQARKVTLVEAGGREIELRSSGYDHFRK